MRLSRFVAHIAQYSLKFRHDAKLGVRIEKAVFVPDTVGDGEGYQLKLLASSRMVKLFRGTPSTV